ncbi:hypothetical protein M569_08545 [Genlisea aurea]|uniref:Protease Do-like PDZ domain-containing protein n=1 Tax=Genlisea aurea TaxID=192259 RepID=S8E1N9_9LAMI|nr:hypothetical protein M569_08545 [Genlisea aurea]
MLEFEDKFLVVLERELALAASASILRGYGIPSERSADLLEPYIEDDGALLDADGTDETGSGFDGLLRAWRF